MTTAPIRPCEKVAPFPWEAIERVSREVVTTLPAVRRALRRAVDAKALAASLGEIIGASVRLGTWDVELREGPDLPTLHGAAFVLETSDARWRMGVELERDFAATLVGKLLRRPVGLLDPSRPVEAAIVGAAAALVTKAARVSHDTCLVPVGLGQLRVESGERVVCVHLTVLVDDEAYAAKVTFPVPGPTAVDDVADARAELSHLDLVPITLPLVVAVSSARRAELSSLETGDLWLPGEGWTLRREGEALLGRGHLMAPASERGIEVELRVEGSLLVGATTTSPWEEAMHEIENEGETKTAAEAVLDAPVVVRVEMGSVTLTAREWAKLSPGDVVALGKRVAEPVVLRVAGVEVARGELVDVEGELGVRILATASERG